MVNKYHNTKENDSAQDVKIIGETSRDEEVLKPGQIKEEKLMPDKDAVFGGSIKKAGEKISLILVFALLLLSIVQSVELFNLQAQIAKGQFNASSSVPAAGNAQGLPAQQGGC